MANPRLTHQARRELDRRFRKLDTTQLRARPHRGWVRAIRTALGMSQSSLGERLGIAQSSVALLERAEATGGITIAKLGELATALDCTLMYALVPNSSLEDTVMRQARRVAATRTGYVASTMSLEDQSVAPDQQADQLDEAARELVASGKVWSPLEKQSNLT